MAGPNTLNEPGNNIWYPTWTWPGNTQLFVQSLDPVNWGIVTVEAGGEFEEVVADGGATTSATGALP